MRRRAHGLALVLAALALAACAGSDSEPSDPSFERARVVIETKRGPVPLSVEIAETDEQREFGLMFRKSLPRDAGMLFLFPADTAGGFWMKNTLIPLSIAFFDARRRIVRILDMEPCREDPCPVYDPGVAYRGALEVNAGAFRRWRVRAGDRIAIER